MALGSMISSTDINTFFPQINGNLTRVTWAHAVNNQSYLREALSDTQIMMIEADVILGIKEGGDKEEPIMAHSTTDTSNLSLDDFLQAVEAFNDDQKISVGKGKGIKLDFKQTTAFEAAVEYIEKYDKGKYPFWLNADILPGPGDPDTELVNASIFVNKSMEFPNSTLSLGWTTQLTNIELGYTNEQITTMKTITTSKDVPNSVTFAVRAALVANSMEQMKNLITTVPNSTLTIWSHSEDDVNVNKLREVILEIGVTSVFIDVPQELRDKLNLGPSDEPGSSTKITSMMGLLTAVLFIVLCL